MVLGSLHAGRIGLSTSSPSTARTAAHGIAKHLLQAVTGFARAWRAEAIRQTLIDLDDHQLQDIGLWRCNIPRTPARARAGLEIVHIPDIHAVFPVEHTVVFTTSRFAVCSSAAHRRMQFFFGSRAGARHGQSLSALSDHMLRDIGLTRADVSRELAEPSWKS